MKRLIIIAISVVIIGIGFVGYTLYDAKRFSDEIKEVPTPESNAQQETTPTVEKPKDNEPSTNTAESTDAAPTEKDALIKAHERMHTSKHPHTHENLPEGADASTHKHDPNAPYYPPKTLADYGLKPNDGERYIAPMFQNRADPNELHENSRIYLTKKYGDTPKVKRYLEVSRKVLMADSYTVKELYDYLSLKNELYEVVGDQSYLHSLRQRAEETPNLRMQSLQSILKNRKASILPPGTKSITEITNK